MIDLVPVILVCGSAPRRGRFPRPGFRNRALVVEVVETFDPLTVVIEGGAEGPDRWARQAAENRGLHVAEVRALWPRYGRAAGSRRNVAMLKLRPSHVCAFWDGSSPGTHSMIELARNAGVPIITIYREDGSSELVHD